ncbi:hypothetical protein ACIQV3_22375 [Streptomyces sp. NPDC099050]|uniref:hypothetical protein n=1 Tax=Streptomyces sp. NPDC099050 TaxID=3366100 RepID=UPI0037F28E1A
MTAPTPDIARLDVPLAQLDADLQQMLRLKREAADRQRAGELAEQWHQMYDLDADSIPFPGAVYGSYLQLGGTQ